MSIDKKSYVPRYFQLKELLERQIIEKNLKAGDLLPSERQLAQKYKLSRVTVVRAISMLADKGLVVREHGLGTFVTAPGKQKAHSKTNTIGLIMPESDSDFLHEMYAGIEQAIRKHKYKILIHKNTEEHKEKIDISFFSGNADGLLVMHADPKVCKKSFWKLKKAGIPFVALDRTWNDQEIDSVNVDNVSGAYEAVSYLIKLGHRRISIILNEPVCQPVLDRFEGYKKALRDNGLKIEESLIVDAGIKPGQNSMDAGWQSMKKLLKLKERPTAVFVISDLGAIGALKAVRDKGLSVPDDISIIGFDDINTVSFLDPPLTTVAQPKDELGERAVELLIRKIENNIMTLNEQIVLKPTLIKRKSCRDFNNINNLLTKKEDKNV